jgi:hypothetical protein
VAVSNGLPVDTDGDGQADYFEDSNGNGIFETTTDFGDWTNFLYVPNTATNFQSITEDEAEKFDRPDAMGAVGPNHYMAVLNFVVKIYDKASGQPIVTNSLNEFLGVTITNGPYAGTYPNPNHPSAPYTGDPRVVYDPGSERWFACGLDGSSGNILLAVSKTHEPVGTNLTTWISSGWDHYLVPMGWLSGTNWSTNFVDQPKLAVDGNGVYIAGYALINAPPVGTVGAKLRIAALPKAPLADFSATAVQTNFIFDSTTDANSYVTNAVPHAQPAASFDSATTNDLVWFIDVVGTNLYYNQLRWANGLSSAPTFQLTNWGRLFVNESYSDTSTKSAPQLGTGAPGIDLLDSRLMMATLRTLNGAQFLWTCHHIWVNQYGTNGTPDRSAVEWFKIQLTPSANIAESGRIFDNAGSNPKFYYYPSLAVNRNGDMVIGFSGSSVNDYVSAFYWGRLSNGVSLSTPIRYFAGKDWLASNIGAAAISFGDYSNTTLDPTDELTFWTIQQYAETRTSGVLYYAYTWGTRITAIRPY